MILWLKAFHLFFIIAWFAGIFYLPRIFVYHAMTDNLAVKEQFLIMERRLWLFVTPFMVLAIALGIALIMAYGSEWFAASKWLHYKIALVIPLIGYHFYLFHLFKQFRLGQAKRSDKFYRLINELPVLVLLAIVILAVVKP